MKKKILVIAFACAMAITNIPMSHISANTNPKENDEFFEVSIPENEVRENFNIYGFSSEEDYQTELSKFLSKRQKRDITVAGVFTITTTACYIIQAINNFDPCAWAIKNIWNGLKKPPKGKYKVTRKFIKGRVPNCQPMHSYQCNAGYWKYSFQKIK
ncbi:hypothetical protein WKT02_10990 [Erysipelotrichaceae bacterium HCN-30851]